MLIKEALTIIQSANSKIQELGLKAVDIEGSPQQPQVEIQLRNIAMRYSMVLKHIILNDDGDEILGTIGQNDSDVNKVLIDLQELIGPNPLPGLPVPRVSYYFPDSGGLPNGNADGDLLYFNNGQWTLLPRGNDGNVLVSTPTTVQWQSVVGNGIPAGGTAGQYLIKDSNTPYDVVWDTLTLSKVTDVTSSAAEVNKLDGANWSTAESNTLVGINTGLSIQDQLDGKMSNSLSSANIFVGSAGGVATGVAVTGVISITNAGLVSFTPGSIQNADINAAAAITRSKLANGTAYRILVNDASGVISENAALTGSRVIVSDANGHLASTTVTATTIAFMDATSSVQTQLNNRLSFSSSITPAQGDLIYFNGTAWVNLGIGTNGQLLKSNGTIAEWVTDPPTGLPSGGTTNQVLRKIDNTDYNAEWHTLVVADLTDLSALAADINLLAGAAAFGVTSTHIQNIAGSTSNLQSQITQKQDRSLPHNAIWVGNVSNVPTALSAGTNGYVLTISSGAPTWQPSVAGFSNPMTTEGDLIIGDTGGAAIRLGIGTSGQVLTSNGTTASWVSPVYVTDGDKGDVTVSASGATWTVDANINKAWTGTHSFVDGNLSILGSSDATKIAKFEVDGFTTATTRTFTLPDNNGTVALTSDLSGWLTGTLTNNLLVDGGSSYNFTLTNLPNFLVNAYTGTVYTTLEIDPGSALFRYFNSSVTNDETYEGNLDIGSEGVIAKWSGDVGATGAAVEVRVGNGADTESAIDGFHVYAKNTDYSVVSSDLKFRIQRTGEVTLNLGSDATGDIPYRNSSGYITRLAKGSEGTILRAGASVPAYSTFTIPNTISALSTFVSNTANVLTEVTPAAGQSIRVNAGGTAWEAYTPGGGGIGGSTGSVDNALLRADGTGGSTVQSSSVIISDTADITLGTSSLAGSRLISAVNNTSNAPLSITAESTVEIYVGSGLNSINHLLIPGQGVLIGRGEFSSTADGLLHLQHNSDDTGISPLIHLQKKRDSTTGFVNDVGVSLNFDIETADDNFELIASIEGLVSDITSTSEYGDLVFKTMIAGASASERMRLSRGLALFGNPSNWQSGVNITFINNATTAPTGNPADGVFEYSTDVEGTAEKYIRTESGAVVCTSGLLEPVEISGTTATLGEEHRGKFLYFTNAAGCTVTVPTTLKKGFSCILMQDDSTGTISLTGATVNGKTATTAQYDKIGLVHYKDTDIYFGA